jgi:hypothetical protein
MKIKFISVIIGVLFTSMLLAQTETADSTGYPGDNLNLEAVLDLFRQSESPEDFEKKLNTESYGINNLDLNEDGQTDYIHVDEYHDGDVRVLVLRVYLGEKDVQDIATLEIEKTGAQEAMIQIVGDETVYGGRVISEPFEMPESKEEEEEKNDTKDKNADESVKKIRTEYNRKVVNVWGWPSVTYMYRNTYKPWRSPWRWRYYPDYWRPWRPIAFTPYYEHIFRHRFVYRTAPMRRVVVARKIYTPHKKSSKVVKKRTTVIRKSRRNTTIKRNVTRSRRN